MRRTTLVSGVVVLVAGGVAAAVVLGSGGGSASAGAVATEKTAIELKGCPSDDSVNFDQYSLGKTFQGLKLTTVDRVCDPPAVTEPGLGSAPPASRQNFLAYVYGDCTPAGGETACAPPLQVQNLPACERNLSLYDRYPDPEGDPYPHVVTEVRGVAAASFDDGTRLEVYTGDVTVVIFGEDPEQVKAAALELQGTWKGGEVTPDQALPAPADGALAGKLAC